jgi:uncharacterized membrane protein
MRQGDHLTTWIVIGFLLILSGYAVLLGASEIPNEARQMQSPEYLGKRLYGCLPEIK